MADTEEIPVPGVRGLDHTADVGLKVSAPDLPELFRRAALGTIWLVLEDLPGGESLSDGEGGRKVDLVEEDLPGLMRSWLRTVLFWEEVDSFLAVQASLMVLPAPQCGSPDGQGFGLTGWAAGVESTGARIREIKGVTFHGLRVERIDSQWYAQVIFDV